ncbi:MAG: BatD family protein [Chloroflexota bacterium]
MLTSKASLPNQARLIPLLLTLVVLLSPQVGLAQGQSPIVATVDRTTLSLNETFVLTIKVTLTQGNAPQPVIPDMQDFRLVGNSSSTQVSIINGNMTQSQTYQYRLQPVKAGVLIIAPIGLTLNGQTYQTDPIEIVVAQQQQGQSTSPIAPGQSQLTGQNLFVEAEVDNPTPYPGQQLTYTFRFYQANTPGRASYVAPTFNGFWIEQQPNQNQYTQQTAGRIYHVAEVQTILFPTRVEPLTITPAKVSVRGSLFSPETELVTDAVLVDVQPLPDGAPDGFQDAVGQFTIQANIDSQQAELNEPVTLRLTLAGIGNMNTLPDPIWPDMINWRTFDSQATVQTNIQDGQFGGTRTVEWVLIPEKAGSLTIPPISYVYFDPGKGSYETISTQAIDIEVQPAEEDIPPPPTLPGTQKTAIEQIGSDIRHIKPAPATLPIVGTRATDRSGYWLAWLLPVLLIVGYAGWRWKDRYQKSSYSTTRKAKAYKVASKALSQVEQDSPDLYSRVGQIIMTYLSAKLDSPVAGLTHTALGDLLINQAVPQPIVDDTALLLEKVEAGRFAPSTQHNPQRQRFLRDVEALLSELEDVL